MLLYLPFPSVTHKLPDGILLNLFEPGYEVAEQLPEESHGYSNIFTLNHYQTFYVTRV